MEKEKSKFEIPNYEWLLCGSLNFVNPNFKNLKEATTTGTKNQVWKLQIGKSLISDLI